MTTTTNPRGGGSPSRPLDRERITVSDAAKRTSYSRAYLYRLHERGEIEGVKAGRSVRLYTDSLEAWLDRNSG
jgi:excisionase family DNA binding protein